MSAHIEFTANVNAWDESPYLEFDANQGKLTRAKVGQKLEGAIQGESVTEFLMAYQPDGSATFIGQQHVVGTLAGRTGTFVAHSQGRYDGNEASATWSVVPGSGRDGLRGLRGQGTSVAPHGSIAYLTFDYDFDSD
jgi:hypothetical protein